MRLSNATDYALRILTFLVNQDRPVPTATLARELSVSPRYLMITGSKLRDAGYVSVAVGPRGEYVLGMPPSEISVYEIIVLMEGSLRIPKCQGSEKCVSEGPCALHSIYSSPEEKMTAYLKACTIEKIASKPHEPTPT